MYSIIAPPSAPKYTATTSKWTSSMVGLEARYALAAFSKFLFFLPSTASDGRKSRSERVFTSTKCRQPCVWETISTSRWRERHPLCRIRCPREHKYRAAASSPATPVAPDSALIALDLSRFPVLSIPSRPTSPTTDCSHTPRKPRAYAKKPWRNPCRSSPSCRKLSLSATAFP